MSDFEQFKAQEKRYGTFYERNDLVIQEYIPNPFLLDGYKFDLRIYVLIKSVEPLEIHIHREGLVRLATVKYEKVTTDNLRESCMHLTNYAINKDSGHFVVDNSGEKGSKRNLSSLWKTLSELGHDTDLIWKRIEEVIVKTVLIVQPEIKNLTTLSKTNSESPEALRKCFEILGFDVMLDSNLRPIVLEVNHSPSFTCDSQMDWDIKSAVISDTVKLLKKDFELVKHFQRQQKRNSLMRLNNIQYASSASFSSTFTEESQTEQISCGDYVLAYPCSDPELQSKYAECLQKVAETIRDNKAATTRQKYIREKINEAETSLKRHEEWKNKHRSINSALISHIDGDRRRKLFEPVIVPRKVERYIIEKQVLKPNVMDLNFDFPFP